MSLKKQKQESEDDNEEQKSRPVSLSPTYSTTPLHLVHKQNDRAFATRSSTNGPLSRFPLVFTASHGSRSYFHSEDDVDVLRWGDKTWPMNLHDACFTPCGHLVVILAGTILTSVQMYPNFNPMSVDPFAFPIVFDNSLEEEDPHFFMVDCDRRGNILLVGPRLIEIRDSRGVRVASVKIHNPVFYFGDYVATARMSQFSDRLVYVNGRGKMTVLSYRTDSNGVMTLTLDAEFSSVLPFKTKQCNMDGIREVCWVGHDMFACFPEVGSMVGICNVNNKSVVIDRALTDACGTFHNRVFGGVHHDGSNGLFIGILHVNATQKHPIFPSVIHVKPKL